MNVSGNMPASFCWRVQEFFAKESHKDMSNITITIRPSELVRSGCN